MKKYFAIFLSMLLLLSCRIEKTEPVEENVITINAGIPGETELSGKAALVEIDSKGVFSTTLSSQTSVKGSAYLLKFNMEEPSGNAPYKYVAAYPAEAFVPDGTSVSFAAPALQTYSGTASAGLYYCMSGSKTERPESMGMNFEVALRLLKLNFKGLDSDELIRNVAVTSTEGKIAGERKLDLSLGRFDGEIRNTSSTVNASPEKGFEDKAVAFVRTLPVNAGSTFRITLVTDRNIYKWESVQIGSDAGANVEVDLNAAQAQRQDELRILLIGNSFTQDACHQLPALLCGFAPRIGPSGFKVTICQCYYGGRTVPQYNEGWATSSDYTRHLALPGEDAVSNTSNQNLKIVAGSGRWDIVTIQEHTGSYLAWEWNAVEKKHFEELIEKVAATQEVRPQFYYIFTQSYQDFSCIGNSSIPHMTFSDQAGMFRVTAAFAKSVMEELPFAAVIPTGTMLQNLRQTPLANATCLSRDGYHMDYGIARYGAACCCYMQMIYDRCGRIPLSENTYRSSLSDNTVKAIRTPITDENVPIAQQAALDAIASPWSVTYQNRRYGPEGSAGENPGTVDQGKI